MRQYLISAAVVILHLECVESESHDPPVQVNLPSLFSGKHLRLVRVLRTMTLDVTLC